MDLRRLLCLIYFTTIFANHAHAEVRLPKLISDGMVLQRDAKVKIWGWAEPNEKVTVSFRGKTYQATTSATGVWHLFLSAAKAGGPYTMELWGSNKISLKNILIGDVWVCSGQSNMVLPMERVKEKYAEVIATSENPSIRQFVVPLSYDFKTPHKDVPSGSWEVATPKNILRFSATAYFFARTLFEKYGVPIGLINASIGGSPVEAWVSEDVLKRFPQDFKEFEKFKDQSFIDSIVTAEQGARDRWHKNLWQSDKGQHGAKKWYDTTFDASQWPVMPVPGFWHDRGLQNLHGVVWYRKEVHLPASLAGKRAKLLLGRLVDSDSTYVNGRLTGTIGYQYPPRRYDIAPNVLKAGKNIITVRIINQLGKGGFAVGKPYTLTIDGQVFDLTGEWQYQIGAATDTLAMQTFVHNQPVGLFNGMIAPLNNYAIKGIIWYQGESSTSKADTYDQKLSALISDWRQQWGMDNLPFLFVQLANFKTEPADPGWAKLRQAQLKALRVPCTAMAVAIDVGEWNDLHPLNKEDVGKRLALAARHVAYGEKHLVYSGPIYKSMKTEGNKIILTFSHTGSGLVAKGGTLTNFTVAGSDHKFVAAEAQIRGNTVVVSSNDVADPKAVRYAWSDNPENITFYNQEGLPASPFSTID